MFDSLPYSEACERNKGPILDVLGSALQERSLVLEIGAGTGQHAVHFARHLPSVSWLPTDRVDYLDGLAARVAAEGLPNLCVPLELDVRWPQWPRPRQPWGAVVDVVYSANTLHIMSWAEVQAFFHGVGRTLGGEGLLAVYGPFRYSGHYTSASNAAFDRSLRDRDPASGIRDFEAVDELAGAEGLELQEDHRMPANNQMLVWRKVTARSPLQIM